MGSSTAMLLALLLLFVTAAVSGQDLGGAKDDQNLANMIGPDGIAFKYYIVELQELIPGDQKMDLVWSDLAQLMPDGHVIINIDAGYAKTAGNLTLTWTNSTLLYGETNFTSGYTLAGLRRDQWYMICFKATHVYNNYGIQSSVCNYRKTYDSNFKGGESVFRSTGLANSKRLLLTVRLDATPFPILNTNVTMYRSASSFPHTPHSFLATNRGQSYVVSFESLSPSTVYSLCPWAEHAMRGLDDITNYTLCKDYVTKSADVDVVVLPGGGPAASRSINLTAATLEEVGRRLTGYLDHMALLEVEPRRPDRELVRLKTFKGNNSGSRLSLTALTLCSLTISSLCLLTLVCP